MSVIELHAVQFEIINSMAKKEKLHDIPQLDEATGNQRIKTQLFSNWTWV